MARRLVRFRVPDEAGNALGGSGTEVRVFTDDPPVTVATIYPNGGVGAAIAQPLVPNAGGQTTLTIPALLTDTVLTVADVSTFAVGQLLKIADGVNTVYRTIIAINAGASTVTLDSAVGFAFAISSTQVNGPEMQGIVGFWVDDSQDYYVQTKNVATGVVMPTISIPSRTPSGIAPNLVLNSDFGRRTVFGVMMPEVFTDTSGFQQLDGGAAPTVAANGLVFAAANNHIGYPKSGVGGGWFRDCRLSVQFKAVSATGVFTARTHYVDANNFIEVMADGANFMLRKTVAGTLTQVAFVAQTLVLNNRYWLEIEAQGTTYIVKLYSSGAASALKSAATLLQTLTATIADAAVAVGGVSFTSNQATCVIGEVAGSPGGFYVEGWLPESWGSNITFGGTIGGQIIGYDETADSGPQNKQWTPIAYIPVASRTITGFVDTPDGSVLASTSYVASFYEKTTGIGGTGALIQLKWDRMSSASVSQGSSTLNDAAETVYTRQTVTATTEAGTRRARLSFLVNPAATATGTARFSLPQLEQGSAVSAWRPAPADDAPIVWELRDAAGGSTTSAGMVELNSRDQAADVFLPWDANVLVAQQVSVRNSGAGNIVLCDVNVDGANVDDGIVEITQQVLADNAAVYAQRRVALAAGKHRIANVIRVNAGTVTWGDRPTRLFIIATRGR